ncbi:uncharacterized protein LOC142728938 isoform X3 [Rhinoderma darwinii]|uniref:uncharacterized protein LOC142728938 isoform X3 n=1 Tax=Rhinoderma darwinii TaxID=43563 RepID=UPI003F67A204
MDRAKMIHILQDGMDAGVLSKSLMEALIVTEPTIQTPFLLPKIHKDPPDLHRKETSTNSFLHATSSHPRHTIEAIPTGRLLRVKKICSTHEDLKFRTTELRKRLAQQGCSRCRNVNKAH